MTALPLIRERHRGALASTTALAIAALQLALFLPTVNAGRAADFGPYRADGVALVFGTTWALAFALAASRLTNTRQATSLLLTLLGLLTGAYSREPFLLYLGWEVATAGLWLASDYKPRFGRIAVALHLAGLPFLMAIVLGLVVPFAPPQGGVAAPWHIAIVTVIVTVVLMRVWLSGLLALITQTSPLARLYAMSAPILLVKALVAAPFDPFGIWLLALVGTAMLLVGGRWSELRMQEPVGGRHRPIEYVFISSIIAALGLSSGTPLAAAGAVWLMLSGAFLASTMRTTTGHRSPVTGHFAGIALALSLPGIWLTAQGALDLRYGLIAALLLPCLMMRFWIMNYASEIDLVNPKSNNVAFLSLIAVLALALAAYPQLPVEFAIRPVALSMAGGVRALASVTSDWGVGLMVRPTGASLSAGLPATGMVLAVFLAFVTLYWLRRLAQRFVGQARETEAR